MYVKVRIKVRVKVRVKFQVKYQRKCRSKSNQILLVTCAEHNSCRPYSDWGGVLVDLFPV